MLFLGRILKMQPPFLYVETMDFCMDLEIILLENEKMD